MLSRRSAREAVVGLIYELGFHSSDENVNDIIATAREERDIPVDDYIDSCYFGICSNLQRIDEEIEKYSSGWKVDRISKVSLAVLRLAVFELIYAEPKLPYSIAINEAVELCKQYAEDGAASFVNGLLNTLAKANGCEA
ncbi:MAG: transcription antitermination factor NusB [Clostridia bacterium]|nr:transcription antitermination factor NusB [Clostridia bacterium]